MFDSFNPNNVFTFKEPTLIQLFGEGYGINIQKGKNYIADDVNFILFDIRVGKWWLQRNSLEDLAHKMGLKIVPIIGYMTLNEAIEFVKNGYKSTIAENKNYDAEGLVLKTKDGLLDRSGNRIITKIKTKDFAHLNK
jgi:ATP-dependent RNA circularization protein (DNA/RNA ligase family)